MKTGISGLDRAQTHAGDLPLFRQLGLQPYDIETHVEHLVGEVRLESGASVKIWVQCLPADFWTFEVLTVEGAVFTVSTGSGMLTAFWHTINLIANGMIIMQTGTREHMKHADAGRSTESKPLIGRNGPAPDRAVNIPPPPPRKQSNLDQCPA